MILTQPNPVLVGPEQFRARSRAEMHALAFLARYRVEQTRAAYTISLRQWFEWCEGHAIDPLEATRAQIEVFARELEVTGRTLATVASKLNALAGFYRYAVIDGILERDPMVNVRRPRVERISSTQGLTRTEFADVLRTVEAMTPRDHALVCLLGLNGLRVSEACSLSIDDLGLYRANAQPRSPARAARPRRSRCRTGPRGPLGPPSATAPPGQCSSHGLAPGSTAAAPRESWSG